MCPVLQCRLLFKLIPRSQVRSLRLIQLRMRNYEELKSAEAVKRLVTLQIQDIGNSLLFLIVKSQINVINITELNCPI